MKILISSLQVSESGSKGHLHPAVEIALEALRRGYDVTLLPIPATFGEKDRQALNEANIHWIKPPNIPQGILKTREQLAKLTQSSQSNYQAYESFLITPLECQYHNIIKLLEVTKPDIIIYDLLVYSVPLAAQTTAIPCLGYCAGLKLIADEELLDSYINIARHLKTPIQAFLKKHHLQANFRHLELLSDHMNYVFAPTNWMASMDIPKKVKLAGPLHTSTNRGDSTNSENSVDTMKHTAVLSFGSVLDPYNYPVLMDALLSAIDKLGLSIVISSPLYAKNPEQLPAYATAKDYLPLTSLLPETPLFIHHGGANSFSEAFYYGTPQFLIPLTNDQPIQADLLNKSGAGFSLEPQQCNIDNLTSSFSRLLDTNDPLHKFIHDYRQQYQQENGAVTLVNDIEQWT